MTILGTAIAVVYLVATVLTALRVRRQIGGCQVPGDAFGCAYLGLAWPMYWLLEVVRWHTERKEGTP